VFPETPPKSKSINPNKEYNHTRIARTNKKLAGHTKQRLWYSPEAAPAKGGFKTNLAELTTLYIET